MNSSDVSVRVVYFMTCMGRTVSLLTSDVATPLRSPVSFKKKVSGRYFLTSPESRAAAPIKWAPGTTWLL